MKENAHLVNSVSIAADSTLGSIQEAFNGVYPFLKIDFFKNNIDGNHPRPIKLDAGKFIKEFNGDWQPIELSLHPATTVLQLEQLFNQLLDLNIQVFRKSGSVWVETLLTEHWTLEQQNEEGRHFSSPDMNAASIKKANLPASSRSK